MQNPTEKRREKWIENMRTILLQIANDMLNGICFLSAITLIDGNHLETLLHNIFLSRWMVTLVFMTDKSTHTPNSNSQQQFKYETTQRMYDWALIRINSFRRPYSLCWNTQRSLGWVCLTDNSLISTNVHTHIHKIERELEWNPPEFFFCAVHKCWLWQFAYDDVTNDGSFYQIHKSIYDKNTKAIITDDWKRNLWCKKVMIRWLFFHMKMKTSTAHTLKFMPFTKYQLFSRSVRLHSIAYGLKW